MKKGAIGLIFTIIGGIITALGSAVLTVDTSEKVLGKFVDETNDEIKKLEEES
jgi:hypothetical protein